MNKLTNVSKIRSLANDSKGATMVEYALLLFVILVIAAVAFKTLGKTVNTAATNSNSAF